MLPNVYLTPLSPLLVLHIVVSVVLLVTSLLTLKNQRKSDHGL